VKWKESKVYVSILVFLDQALKVPEDYHEAVKHDVSILVFLDQALKDYISSFRDFIAGRFNPCFPGSSAESVAAKLEIPAPQMFQSLFSWIKR